MSINWKVRIKNPVWWAGVVAAIFVPMLAAVGTQWSDITSWAALWNVIKEAFGDPVTLVAVVISVWNTINDPTTKGLCDSERALGYECPSCAAKEESTK